MASQPIPLGTSDITVYGKDPLDSTFKTYGYFYASGTDIRENRGDAFIGAFGTGDSTYQDAEPFKRRVWTNWNGGMGQVSADHKEGGTGQGGDDAKFFDASMFTKKGNIMMPGMQRNNYVFNNQQWYLVGGGAQTYQGDNMIPQEPAPVSHPAGSLNKFTVTDGLNDTFTRSGAPGSSETTGGYPARAYTIVQGTWNCNGSQLTSTSDANQDGLYAPACPSGHPDYEVSCDISGTVVSATNYRIGILWGRLLGTSNYIRAYLWQNKIYLDKVLSGTATNITNVAYAKADGVVGNIRMSFIGSQVQVFLDGATSPIITYTIVDSALLTGTGIGLAEGKGGTPATALTFDNLNCKPIINQIRLLGKVDGQTNTPYTVTCGFGQTTAANTSTFSGTINSTIEFKWFTLTSQDTRGYTVLPPGSWYLRVAYNANVTIGGYMATFDSTSNILAPYWQYIPGSGIPSDLSGANFLGIYRLWSPANAGYVFAIVTSNAVYGTGATSLLSGVTVDCAVVFDNTLYVSTSSNCYKLSGDDVYNGNAATSITGTMRFTGGQMIAANGKIFGTDGANIFKYDPTVAIGSSNPVTLTATNSVGTNTSNGRNRINRIIFFRGLLYAFKPEGVFLFYADPDKITSTGSTRIEKIINFSAVGLEDVNNGKYVVEYQGQLVFNVLDDVWLLSPGSNGNNIDTISPPVVRSTGRYISYIDGIITNGQELYISMQGFGVWIYDGSWHKVAKYYDTTPTTRGLSFIPSDPSNWPTNTIWYADGNGYWYNLVPSTTNGSYLRQIYKNDQAKYAYWISSLETMDLAEVTKYLHSWVIKASSQGYNMKVVAAIYQPGSGQPNFKLITEQAYNQGLWRDTWSNSNTVAPYRVSDLAALTYPVVVPGSCYFTDSDFANEKSIAEKTVSSDYVQYPTTIVQCQFIFYMWKANGLQYESNNLFAEIAYIDAMVLKFLPILDYIPLYHVTIDAQVLFDDGSINVAGVNDSIRFLRAMSQSRTPVKFQFYDATGSVKTVVGYMQNTVFSTDAISVVEGDPPAKTCQFDILSIQGEPVN